ncbi:outer membrane receptor for ferrienterochelin and colicins [Arcicella aurantiaca]|uniref:Outer membrane receptor for ferrienterochelin and colicins n=1 Tax=Arcicella aurantiaca TaxID=591202 RepID=A0A316DBS4_9BACT|nr:outer membrane receptor for ferrienterochelin and colicins [Arcicella aurantiaca]
MSSENTFASLGDSLTIKELKEIVVTATRNERMLSSLPMPVTLIGQGQIKAMGALRLNDVLAEQTGLFIQNDHGQGIQIQGFSPDYTLILVDGEPLIGRTAGTLELSRLAVGNIKQIEIVKGPSSSLYGSEALAGVINIITEKPNKTKGSFSARYGTNQTSDLGLNLSFNKNKLGFNIFSNRYQSGGYDFSPETFGATVSPFKNYTLSPKLTYDFSQKIKFNLSGRYFNENQENALSVGNDRIIGAGTVNDWSINPVMRFAISDKLKLTTRYYTSQYETNSVLKYQKNDATYDETFFNQNFHRPELQIDYSLNAKHNFTVGTGYIRESVSATRYDETKHFETKYGYLQYENTMLKSLNLTLGGRFDAHSAYSSQFSPKISASYEVSPKITVRGSVGVGFKAPDFRQLYLNFTNSVAGYSVFGTQEISRGIAQLMETKQISELLFDIDKLGLLRAENSIAFNFGGKLKLDNQLTMNLNIFRNDIDNLIQSQAIALKTNGQSVFSYQNLNKVFTQGIEIEISKQFSVNHHQFSLNAGYQLMEAKDKDIVQKLQNGEIYRRDPETYITVRVKDSEYEGLFNRSKHSANLKLFYENTSKRITASLRGVYRSKYGFADYNGNGIADVENEFVNGYILWNFALSKELMKHFHCQIGCDNVLNFKNTTQIPNLAGRLVWGSVALNF